MAENDVERCGRPSGRLWSMNSGHPAPETKLAAPWSVAAGNSPSWKKAGSCPGRRRWCYAEAQHEQLPNARMIVEFVDDGAFVVLVYARLGELGAEPAAVFVVEAVEAFLGHEQHGLGAVSGRVVFHAQEPEEHLLALVYSQPLGVPRWERAVEGAVPEEAVLVEPGDPGGSSVGVVDDGGSGGCAHWRRPVRRGASV